MTRKKTSRQCRCDDLEARLERVEELARSNRRELDIQFQRIADLQAMFDSPIAERNRRKSDGKAKPDGKGRPFWPDGDGFR